MTQVTWFSLSARDLASLQQAFQPLHLSQRRGVRYSGLKNRQENTLSPHTARHSV